MVDTKVGQSAWRQATERRPNGKGRLHSAADGFAPESLPQGIVSRVLWYKDRLAAMSALEVRHRLVEQVKRAVSHRRYPAHAFNSPGQLLPFPGLAEGLKQLSDEEQLLDQWREAASDVAAGRISLLGATWPYGASEQRWHLDPVTRKSWPPEAYCFDIPYRHSTSLGDVKYVWELNRLQYLQPIAALAALEGDRVLAQLCIAEVEDWISKNPPFHGVNWASGIELALRVVSLLVVATLLDEAGLLDISRARLWSTLAAHGYWIRRFPSCYSSANNHLIAEAGALYLLGCLAPDLPDAEEWHEYGRATLATEAHLQIYPDGVGAEQSPTYTAFSLEWLLICGEVARRRGEPFPEPYWQRIAAAADFLRWISDTASGHPQIGDDDGGRVICSQLAPEPYVSSILAAISATLKRPDLAPSRPLVDLRQAFFGRLSSGCCGPTGVRQFAAGGYTVARAIHGETRSLIVLDHGPLGYLSIAAHGHADALAIWLHIDDQPVLVDAGTYLYHSGRSWRSHFRGTPAHNTLSVAGADSSCRAGPFNWSHKARASVRHFDANAADWSIEMEHDGFATRFGLLHRRRVERTGHDDYLITDVLLGDSGSPPVEIGFLLHPALFIESCGRLWIVRSPTRVLLAIEGHGPLKAAVQEAQLEPPRGWCAPSFGERKATRRLVFHGALPTAAPFRVALRILHPTTEAPT